MRNRHILLFGLLATLSPMLALAHENPLPQSCLASSARATPTIYFRLSEQQLRDYMKAHAIKAPAVDGMACVKDCGIIDEWYWANEAAKSTCAGDGSRRGTPSSLAMPYIFSPSTFNLDTDADGNGRRDHHDLYGFEQGLSGMCVACP